MTAAEAARSLELGQDADLDRPAHRYGGQHHRLSLVDQVGARVGRSVQDDALEQRNPTFIQRLLPLVDAALTYFDPEVQAFDGVPRIGPMLIVANHSGGIYMPDY